MDYTPEMFSKNHNALIPLLQSLDSLEIPKNEWPKFSIEGEGYRLNPNNSIVDTYRYLINKYEEKGDDFHWRFTSIVRFLHDNSDALEREGLIKKDTHDIDVKQSLLTMLLDSFSVPKIPVIFPLSSLGNRKDTFILRNVIKRARLQQKGE